MAFRGGKRDCVVYVGELPDDIREREVEDLFHQVRPARSGPRQCSTTLYLIAFVWGVVPSRGYAGFASADALGNGPT